MSEHGSYMGAMLHMEPASMGILSFFLPCISTSLISNEREESVVNQPN